MEPRDIAASVAASREALRRGDFAVGLTHAERALAMARSCGDRGGEGRALAMAATLQVRLRDFEPALRASHTALALLREAGDETTAGEVLAEQAFVYEALGMANECMRCCDAAMRIAESSANGDALLCRLLQRNGMAQARLGDHVGVRRSFERAVEFARQPAHADLLGTVLCNFGFALIECADQEPQQADARSTTQKLQEAVQCLEESAQISARGSDPALTAVTLVNLAAAQARLGAFEPMAGSLARARAIADSSGAAWLLPMVREVEASALRLAGQDDEFIDRMLTLFRDEPGAMREAGVAAPKELYLALKRRCRFAEALHWCEEMVRVAGHRATLQARVTLERMQLEEAYREARAARDELLAADSRAIRLEAERQQLQVLAAELERDAKVDSLTGLPNRRFLDAYLAEAMDVGPLCVAIADADHFKRVNDRFGHGVGDAVLRAVASLMKIGLRGRDAAARYGGEEFLLVFPAALIDEGRGACERLRKRVRAHDWSTIAPGLSVTLSFGLARFEGNESAAELLARADAALYDAKAQGRDRVCVASPTGRPDPG